MDKKLVVAHLLNSDGGHVHLEGTYELVSYLITPYLKEGQYTVSAVDPLGEKDRLTLDQNASLPNTEGNGSQPQVPSDLVTLYRKAKPENQNEEVLIVAYHFTHFKGINDVTKGDIERGFTELRFVPVKAPKDMKGAIRHSVDRTLWLRNADRGRYAVTLAGEEHIVKMLQR